MMTLLFTIICTKLTYSFHKKYMVTSVQASTVITILSLVLLKVISFFISLDFALYSKLAFGASFVGMCSPKKFKDSEVLFFSLNFYILYYFLFELFPFTSGLLGFLAFISVAVGSRFKLLKR